MCFLSDKPCVHNSVGLKSQSHKTLRAETGKTAWLQIGLQNILELSNVIKS